MRWCGKIVVAVLFFFRVAAAWAQPTFPPERYDEPGEAAPGDKMIFEWLNERAESLHARFLSDLESKEVWEKHRERYQREYFHMLGLWPLPEKTPLKATVTGVLTGPGYRIEKLHYQSRPRLYVTANLYRPAEVKEGERLPAVLYVCGHSGRGRNGNKTAFRSHGMWFARHGYVCLIVDTLQLGEIGAIHHGTYRENRWWWHSRGYTSAGVECWNAVRGVDYLLSRADVDPERIGVTGISGGGAASFWAAAADDRIAIAAPVSGMADLPSYVTRRVINGHCDCMFLYNTFEWPWTRIAGLICPRPLLFVNSDHDRIFPMDANERIINRLELLYSRFGSSDQVDAIVSVGGHAYRKDIRKAVYRFFNTHLKNDPREVLDSEVDLVTRDASGKRHHPIDPETLRVFPTDDDIPEDELNTTIDEHFVPIARPELPAPGGLDAWRDKLLGELKRVTFRSLPDPNKIIRSPYALKPGYFATGGPIIVSTEPVAGFDIPEKPKRIVLVVRYESGRMEWLKPHVREGDRVVAIWPRGLGDSPWTRKNPPNYVERSHALLGTTVDVQRVRDVIVVARRMHRQHKLPVVVAGTGTASVTAACAAAFEEPIAGAVLDNVPTSFMEEKAPAMLNILRVCDVPDVIGLIAPRPVALSRVSGQLEARVKSIQQAVK